MRVSASRHLYRAAKFLVSTNLWIALAACALVAFEETRNGLPFDPALLGFVFGGTWASYCLHRLSAFTQHRDKIPSAIPGYQRWLQVGTIIGLIIAVLSFFKLPIEQQGLAIGCGLLAGLYILPIPGPYTNIRALPFLKIFLISLVWTGVTALLPVGPDWVSSSTDEVFWTTAGRFFFILAITLPFDLRDLRHDRRQRTRTLPQILGWRATRQLAWLLLGLAAVVDLISGTPFWPLWLTYLLASGLIAYSSEKRDYLFYGLWLDGLLFLPLLLNAIGSMGW